MILVPVDPKAISVPSMRYARCKAMRVIEEFMQSDHEAVQLKYDDNEYANSSSALSTYKKAARKLRANCVVISRQGKVYLIKGRVFSKSVKEMAGSSGSLQRQFSCKIREPY